MTWAEAKANIATALATAAITAPISQTIKRVYADPPGSIVDVPCAVMFPPGVTIDYTASRRRKNYEVRILLLVSDQELAQAAEIADAYREAIIDLFVTNITLTAKASVALLEKVEAAAMFEYPTGGGKSYSGMNLYLTVAQVEGKTFSG